MSEEERKPFLGKKVGDKMQVNVNELYKTAAQRAAILQVKEEELASINPEFEMEITKIRKFAEPELNEEFFKMAFPGGEVKTEKEFDKMLDEQIAGENSEQKAAAMFLKQKIDAAKGFISAVRQRENTMLSTMRAIVARQKEYFVNGGDEAFLKPMILEDIAKVTGFDISTISRVSNSKYVQTPWSVTPLKYFFSDGVTKSDGTEQSVYELFGVIRELVDNEDKSAPLTDQVLQEMLAARGYNVARRTVAKYREQLNIPVARLRKE
jgi:RNA polymerase sigma-54 factor